MTSQQLVYMELAKNGYDLDEIAAFTHRTTSTIIITLKRAVNCPYKTPSNCRACPLQITCEANYDTVNRLLCRSGCKPMAIQ